MNKEKLKAILEIIAIIMVIGLFALITYGMFYICIHTFLYPLLWLIMICIP